MSDGVYDRYVREQQRLLAEENAKLKAERERLETDLGRARQRCADLEAGASEREALLTEARDLLEPWGGHGDAWPSVGPAISMLIERLNDALQRAERVEAGVSRVRAQCERWRFTPDRRRAAEEMLAELDRAGDHSGGAANVIGYRGAVNASLSFETIAALADRLKRDDVPRRRVQRSAPSSTGLTVVTTDPVEEIAAEPATLERLKSQFFTAPATRLGAQVGEIGAFFGFPLVPDPQLPPGEVHMRPRPHAEARP